MMLLKRKRHDGKARRGSIDRVSDPFLVLFCFAAGFCDRGATPPACLLLFNPKGGAGFGAWLRWLAPYSPLRGCAGTRRLASRQIRLPQHRFYFENTP
jgi:hypothetical protein